MNSSAVSILHNEGPGVRVYCANVPKGQGPWREGAVVAFDCSVCAKRFVRCKGPNELTSGFGLDRVTNAPICFACCGAQDKAHAIATGRAVLYLTHTLPNPPRRLGWTGLVHGPAHVGNWPGTLKTPVYGLRRGHHNIAGCRYDFRFTGPDGEEWSGVSYGDMTQIAHCRRLKVRGKAGAR